MQYRIAYGPNGKQHIHSTGSTKHIKGDIIVVDGRPYRVIVAGVQTKLVAGDGTMIERPMQTLYGEWID